MSHTHALKRFEKLLLQNKTSEAQEVLQSIFSAPLPKKERGLGFLSLALLQMRAANKINRAYSLALDDAIIALKSLSEQKQSLENIMKTHGVKSDIEKIYKKRKK